MWVKSYVFAMHPRVRFPHRMQLARLRCILLGEAKLCGGWWFTELANIL